ncbi:MAG TPA: FHA domain-containing protein [Anaerolineales bacterium]|nr:FHA domain-containing protein [Anaerolineales bacterium]
MSEITGNPLIILAVGAGLCAFWIVSTGAVYWDLRRSRTPNAELAAWIALVALIPGVGLLAYLTWRLLGTFLTPRDPARRPAAWKKRFTAVQRPEGLPARKSTIPAADLLRETMPELAQDVRADPKPDRIALRVAAGPHAAQTFTLARLPATIGRGVDAGIRLEEDLGVSRRHAELYRQADKLRIRDLGSAHGTLVNGFSISDKGLEPGDRIQVGLTEMVLETANRSDGYA